METSRPFPDFLSLSSLSSVQENRLDDVVKRRGLQRSVMQYSTFDWSAIPLSQEKRLMDHPPDQPRIVTVRFR